jgi:hypothetical protein
MMTPLLQDLSRRLDRTADEGSPARAAVARFQVSVSAAIKPARRVRKTGSTTPLRVGQQSIARWSATFGRRPPYTPQGVPVGPWTIQIAGLARGADAVMRRPVPAGSRWSLHP